MFKVTDRRLEKARATLDGYVSKLDECGKFDPSSFEHELKDIWGTGYREIKSAVVDLYRNHGGDYGRVAEYYMRHQAPEGTMNRSFKSALGIRDH